MKRMVPKPGDLLGGSALAVQHEVDLSSATTSGKMSVKEKGVSRGVSSWVPVCGPTGSPSGAFAVFHSAVWAPLGRAVWGVSVCPPAPAPCEGAQTEASFCAGK